MTLLAISSVDVWTLAKTHGPTVLTALVILIVGMIVSKLVLKVMSKGMQRTKVDLTIQGFLLPAVKIVLYVILIVMILSTFGADTTSIVAVIGTAGLAVGLALQSSLSNVAGGIIVLIAKPFKVGDVIETNGVSGTVAQISILYTCLFTDDNKAVYIPNAQVSNAKMVNITRQPTRRLDLSFAIGYTDDFRAAIRAVDSILRDHSLALREPEPIVRLGANTGNAIGIAVQVWVASADYEALQYSLFEQVKVAFDEAGINRA